MKKIVFPLLSLLVMACSTDADEVSIDEIANEEIPNEEVTNIAPVVISTAFSINEHVASGTSIGLVVATDKENDELTYFIDTEVDILINETTGELTTGENLKLDFESKEQITFTVSVFDGKTITDSSVILSIEDIDEFSILNDEQKAVVKHFKHLALAQDATSNTQELMRKWNTPMKLFLGDGISQTFKAEIAVVIAEFNALTTSGDFKMSLVDSEVESNVKVFLGPKKEVEQVFPEMYNEIKDLNVDGYARATFVNDYYVSAQIWLLNSSDVVFKHELGHAIGFGHSDQCQAPEPSVMCSNVALESDFLEIEKKVIRFFYHEDMPSGISAEEINNALANLILLED